MPAFPPRSQLMPGFTGPRRARQPAQTWGPSPLSPTPPALGISKGIFGVADQVSRGWEGAWSFIN